MLQSHGPAFETKRINQALIFPDAAYFLTLALAKTISIHINNYISALTFSYLVMKPSLTLRNAFLGAAVLILAACTVNLEFEIFSSDLIVIAQQKNEVIMVNATVKMDYSEEEAESVKKYMNDNFRDAGNFKVVEEEYSTFLLAEYKLPIIHAENKEFESEQDLITVIVNEVDTGKYLVGIKFDKEQYKAMNVFSQEKFYSDIDLKESEIQFEFRSDNDEEIQTSWRSVYVNSEAYPIKGKFLLHKRDKLVVTLSDIFKEAMKSEEDVLYFGEMTIVQ